MDRYYFTILSHTFQIIAHTFVRISNRGGIMEQKPLKDKICISLDPEVIREIKRLAEEDDRSFSGYINKVLRDHVRTTGR